MRFSKQKLWISAPVVGFHTSVQLSELTVRTDKVCTVIRINMTRYGSTTCEPSQSSFESFGCRITDNPDVHSLCCHADEDTSPNLATTSISELLLFHNYLWEIIDSGMIKCYDIIHLSYRWISHLVVYRLGSEACAPDVFANNVPNLILAVKYAKGITNIVQSVVDTRVMRYLISISSE